MLFDEEGLVMCQSHPRAPEDVIISIFEKVACNSTRVGFEKSSVLTDNAAS